MKKSLPFLFLCLCISPLYSMDRGGQRLYPLLPVGQSDAPKVDEQTHLLTLNFLEKDRLTLVHATPPPYQDLYISEEESKAEIEKLTKILAQTERELAILPGKLPHTLKCLTQERAIENIKSNATVGTAAFGFYMISMIAQLIGDPRLEENGGKNPSIYPFLNNFFGWVGSQMYAGSQCCCRKPENEN